MSFIWTVALCVIALVVVRISHWIYRWSNPKCNGKLPPGSMGFPIIGESMDFFKPFGFYAMPPFITKRISRYGPLFKTNLFGSKTVVATDADVIFEIFRQENKSFIFSTPDAFTKVFGKENLFLKHGNIHKYIKQITRYLVGIEGLKKKIIHDMDRVTQEHLKSMAIQGTFDIKPAISTLITQYMTPNLISNLKKDNEKKLIENFKQFNFDWYQSFFSLSTWKCLFNIIKVRKESMNMLHEVLLKRKGSEENYEDFMETIIKEMEKEDSVLEEDSAINLIFCLAIITQETLSTIIGLAMKFISQTPKVLDELKREHEEIIQKRKDKESGISWEEYKNNMSFTHMVISETLRLANIAPILFKKAVEDVEIKGFTIPAGWIVAVAPSVVHYNPEIYENPLEFNPWRWEGNDVRSGSKTFMAFGGGVRMCVGAEFTRLQMAIFLHHLVTKYDFSLAQECEVKRSPTLHFAKGILINISKMI